jgi:single-strand DNA-binding protein
MSGSVNKVILIGSVGAEPVIKLTTNGTKIAIFSLATSERWKDKTTLEWKSNTEWHKISVLNDALAETVKKYVNKGSKLYIEGSIKSRKWQDKEGVDQYTTEIVLQGFASRLILLDSKENSDQIASTPSTKKNQFAIDDDIDDEIPF